MMFSMVAQQQLLACRVLYKLEGPSCQTFQVGLSPEEMQALDAVTLEQLLAVLKRAHLQTRQTESTYRGVDPKSGRWRMRYRSSRMQRSAVFDHKEDAARAYDRWALQDSGSR